MSISNFDKWQKLTAPLPSPQNFIDWGFYYMISAALQRRVWMPPSWRPCFPNMYPILVGKPGIGKGQVIKTVSEILSYHKLRDVKPSHKAINPDDQKVIDAMIELNEKDKEKDGEEMALIPIAADAITYEALVREFTRAIRRINYYEEDDKGQTRMKIYSHSSLCFCLEEMASLFKKHTENLVNFLIQAYDCGDNYEYVTKHQGRDRIRRLCLNMLAGTTPDFMQSVFNDKIIEQGFSSRVFFIYANKNRHTNFFLKQLSEEQHQYKKDLIIHVGKLAALHGEIKIEPETERYLEEWFSYYQEHPETHASNSLQLNAYKARKNIHTMKVAAAMHFGESTEMCIPLETFKKAIDFLHNEEKTMHYALTLEGNNPLAKISRKVLQFLETGAKEFIDILDEMWGMADKDQLEKALEFLSTSGRIKMEKVPVETGEKVTKYLLK